MSRGVSCTASPTRDLNHWRLDVNSEISAIGEAVTIEARRARRSKRGSASLSTRPLAARAARRLRSLPGTG